MNMLSARVEKWSKDIEQRGILIGEQKGEAKGILKGEAKMLHRLLKEKFNTLPAWIPETLSNANSKQLETWFDRALHANALDEIFKEQNKH
ncbi:DUF4351 domain-containing protein [Magnetococcales bacterium HHB-1]